MRVLFILIMVGVSFLNAVPARAMLSAFFSKKSETSESQSSAPKTTSEARSSTSSETSETHSSVPNNTSIERHSYSSTIPIVSHMSPVHPSYLNYMHSNSVPFASQVPSIQTDPVRPFLSMSAPIPSVLIPSVLTPRASTFSAPTSSAPTSSAPTSSGFTPSDLIGPPVLLYRVSSNEVEHLSTIAEDSMTPHNSLPADVVPHHATISTQVISLRKARKSDFELVNVKEIDVQTITHPEAPNHVDLLEDRIVDCVKPVGVKLSPEYKSILDAVKPEYFSISQ